VRLLEDVVAVTGELGMHRLDEHAAALLQAHRERAGRIGVFGSQHAARHLAPPNALSHTAPFSRTPPLDTSLLLEGAG
jgi:hypothetical protein